MLYRIERTSDWYGANKPCSNALLYKKVDEELGEPNRWCVEIETLDDLNDLIREVNVPIIMKKGHSIELYDDYRE